MLYYYTKTIPVCWSHPDFMPLMMSAWDKIEKVGKNLESFTKNIQGPKKPLPIFYQH